MAFLHAGCKLVVVVCQGTEQILSGGDWGLGVHLQFTQEHSMRSLHFHSPSLSPPFLSSLLRLSHRSFFSLFEMLISA